MRSTYNKPANVMNWMGYALGCSVDSGMFGFCTWNGWPASFQPLMSWILMPNKKKRGGLDSRQESFAPNLKTHHTSHHHCDIDVLSLSHSDNLHNSCFLCCDSPGMCLLTTLRLTFPFSKDKLLPQHRNSGMWYWYGIHHTSSIFLLSEAGIKLCITKILSDQ